MRRISLLLLSILLLLSACTKDVPFTELPVEGAVCLPYSPEGQVVYDAEWTGDFPDIEVYDKTYATITFGMGCFWGPAAHFAVVDGVLRTRVGYAGGDSTTPSYDDLGNHIEVFEVDYDPDLLSYEDMVHLYFQFYDATARPFSQRVTPVIYYRNAAEQVIAEDVKLSIENSSEKGIFTVIRPLEVFYLAEEKHQLSYLKQESSLYKEIREIFIEDDALLLSILASKLNGFIAGYGSETDLTYVLKGSGLSDASLDRLKTILSNRVQ